MTRSNIARCIRRWPTQVAEFWTVEFLKRVRNDQNVLAVVAIGSAVRKEVPSDDLDILVLCQCAGDLTERAPLEIDLRAFDRQSVDQEIKSGHDILGWAVVFGRVLFERKRTWSQVVEKWQGRVPLPNPEVARCRSVATRRRMQEMHEMGDEDAALELELAYLSHEARAVLAEAGIYPASKPELPNQLNEIGADLLAARVKEALGARMRMRKKLVG